MVIALVIFMWERVIEDHHVKMGKSWNEITNALKEIDYQGAIVMEPFIKMGGEVGRDIKKYGAILVKELLKVKWNNFLQMLQ